MFSIPALEGLSAPVRYLIAFAIIFPLFVLLGMVLRRLSGGRLSFPGHDRARSRQPRLGVVDVYDLDRQRQLILLRRDNVEHLLLIGGPNDVVIETNIVRVPGARLPAQAEPNPERIEQAAERALEVPPRPLVEPAPRPEPVVARLGQGEPIRPAAPPRNGPQPALVEPVLKPDIVTLAPAAAAPGQPMAWDAMAKAASRIVPKPTPAPPPAPSPPAPPEAHPSWPAAPKATPPPPPLTKDPADAAVLSDMARQLEEALKRPAAGKTAMAPPLPPPADERPSRTVVSPRQAFPPPGPTPAPPPRAASPSAPPSAPAPRPREAAPPVRPTPEPERQPPAQAEQPRPAPVPAPAAAPAADPFSVEEIEAEFARLLGRPVDRGDKADSQ